MLLDCSLANWLKTSAAYHCCCSLWMMARDRKRQRESKQKEADGGGGVLVYDVCHMCSLLVSMMMCIPSMFLISARCQIRQGERETADEKKEGWHRCPLLLRAESACPVSTSLPPSLPLFNAHSLSLPLSWLSNMWVTKKREWKSHKSPLTALLCSLRRP